MFACFSCLTSWWFFPPSSKNMIIKWDHLPRGENKRIYCNHHRKFASSVERWSLLCAAKTWETIIPKEPFLDSWLLNLQLSVQNLIIFWGQTKIPQRFVLPNILQIYRMSCCSECGSFCLFKTLFWKQRDLWVSLHFNSSRQTPMKGFELLILYDDWWLPKTNGWRPPKWWALEKVTPF